MNNKTILSVLLFLAAIIYLNLDVYLFIQNAIQQLGFYYYPLDDAYIHLSISKNIANYGVWGVTKYQFSSTSSSPLFTIILAALIKIFGDNQLLPLYLNIAAGNILLLFLFITFREKPIELFIVLIGFIFGALLKIQIVTGMEHTLQLLIISTCWISFVRWYYSDFKNNNYKVMFYFSLSLCCIIRYESIFFVSPLIVYLLYLKKYRYASVTLILGFVPIVIFGLYSMSNGGFFFPNTLLAKGKVPFDIVILFKNFVKMIIEVASSFYILLISLLFFPLFSNKLNKKTIIEKIVNKNIYLIILFNIFAHIVFANTGWLYRYDAYLIALLFISIAFSVRINFFGLKGIRLIILIVLSSLSLLIFSNRYLEAQNIMKYASKNIYDQQINMSKFIKQYFNDKTIVANDIGAICYFTDIKLYDLVGLGSTDILKVKKATPDNVDDYINSLDYDLMLIYDEWFTGYTFQNVTKIAELKISNNKICGLDRVSFYVPTKSNSIMYIKSSLSKFKNEIPKDVKLKVYY